MAVKKVKKKPIDVVQAFVDYNLNGIGPDSMSNKAYWYRGSILFWDGTASWRFIEGNPHDGKKVLLVKHIGFYRKGDDPVFQKMTVCAVPDIGVFSRYPNDMMPEGKLLDDRIRFIMLSKAREIVYDNMPKFSGELLERQARASLLKDMDKVYKDYAEYDRLVGCGWGGMPEIYKTQLEEGVQQRIDAYNDPRKVKARERSKARKVAMEALGAEA